MKKKGKKINLNKKNNSLNIFGLVAILLVGFFAVSLLNELKIINFNNNKVINENNKKQKENKEIKKETITVLLVGRGGGNHDAPDLTDTIILAKLNTKAKTIALLSFPRDLYVKYPTGGAGKINSVYPTYYYRNMRKIGNPKDYGMKMLKNKITEISGEKIDYYINVDFKGFKKTINALGGIEIDIKKELVDNKYPNNNYGYQTIIFRKGLQKLNGERALQYARSRKTTSDYDRSLRQQQIIKAVKNKIKEEFFNSKQKIGELTKSTTELYQIFKENVFTDINLKDSISMVINTGILNGEYRFVSSNMNDTCYYRSTICEKGGIVYSPGISVFGTSVELFNGTSPRNISNYTLSRNYSNIALNYTNIGEENYKINIFNSTKRSYIAKKMQHLIKRYGFNIPFNSFSGNTNEIYEKSIIYYNNTAENSDTIKALKLFFDGEFKKLDSPRYSKENAKIEIIIGKDYLEKKDIFSF